MFISSQQLLVYGFLHIDYRESKEKTTAVDWTQIKTVIVPKRGMPPGIHSQARAESAKKAQNAPRNQKMKGKTASTGNK